jgi:hypothetical protein
MVEQSSNRAILTDYYNPTQHYEFPINPDTCKVIIGHRTVEQKLLGRDGSVIQTFGMNPRKVTISGTIKDGVYYSDLKRGIRTVHTKAELINDMNIWITKNTVLTLAGIFANFVGAINVVIQDNNSLQIKAERPRNFDYSLDLIEWTDYNISGGTIQNVNAVAAQALADFNSAANRALIRKNTITSIAYTNSQALVVQQTGG